MSKESAMAALTGTPVPTPPPAPEAAPVAVVPETPALTSTPFNQLAKKEAEFERRRQEFKKEQQLVASEKAKLAEYNTQIQKFVEMRKTDPIAALKEIGFSEADIINYMAEKPEASPEERAAKAASEAAELRIKQFEEAQLKRQQDEIVQRDQSLIQGFKSDLSKVVQADPVKYEYCAHYGPVAEDLMYETTLAVIKESGGKDILTPQQAAEMVESYYEEQDKLMSSFKKRQPVKTDPTPEKAVPERSRTVTPGDPTAPAPKPVITKTRTLHNAATSTIASTRLRLNETHDQKKSRLIEKLRNGG